MARRHKDLARKMKELIRSAEAQGWKAELRHGGHWKLTPPSGKGAVFLAQTPSDWRAAKNNISVMRRYGFDPNYREDKAAANPNSTQHREHGHARLHEAEGKLADAVAAEPAAALNLYLDAIVLAGTAVQEAEHGTPVKRAGKGVRAEAGKIKSEARAIAEKGREALRRMVMSKNPEDIPGGSMGACIAIMEGRSDVRDPGALCQWIRQRGGGGSSGIRLPRKARKSPDARAILRRAMRGT